MSVFTPRQVAELRAKFLESLDGTVDGSSLVTGTVPFSASVPGEFATGLQGASADTAFSWGNHASAGYGFGTGVANLGNHERVVGTAGVEESIVLAATPLGAVMVVYRDDSATDTLVWVAGTDYDLTGSTVNWTAYLGNLPVDDTVDIYYVSE
jgi:hypothetical protein